MTLLNTLQSSGFSFSGFSGDEPKTIAEEIEVPNPVKRKPGRYPQPGWTPTIKKTITKTIGGYAARNVVMTGRPSSWITLWDGMKDQSLPYSLPFNRDQAFRYLMDNSAERVKFSGGTTQDVTDYFAGQGSMDLFYQAKDKVESSDWILDIRRELESAYPKRRRVYGDEGQWVESRRWDGDAFEEFPVIAAPARAIEIVAMSNAPWYMKAEDLAKYGATVWAIVDTLESFGVSVKFTQRYHSRKIFGDNEDGTFNVELKEAGEYISPTFIAGFMTPGFWRRVVWGAFVAASDIAGKEVGTHYGFNDKFPPASYRDGVLTLSHGITDNPSELLPAVLDFIGKASQAA